MQIIKYQSLEIIRGLAALSVVLSHWIAWVHAASPTGMLIDAALLSIGNLVYFPAGSLRGIHPGVIVFIVLSGFVIHLPVARESARWKMNNYWQEFAFRRLMRIAPTYWFGCLLGLMVVGLVSVYPYLIPEFVQNDSGIYWNTGHFIAKLAFMDGLWRSMETTLGNGILVIVSIEVWLYVSYPLTLLIRERFGWGGVFGLAALSHLAAVGLWSLNVERVFAAQNLLTFYLYWVIGAFSAEKTVTVLRLKEAVLLQRWLWALIFFVLYIASGYILTFSGSQMLRSMLLAVFIGLVLLSWTLHESMLGRSENLISKALIWVGDISYSLYIVQTPFMALSLMGIISVRYFGFDDYLFAHLEGLIILLGTFIVAYLVNRYFEKPICNSILGRSSRSIS